MQFSKATVLRADDDWFRRVDAWRAGKLSKRGVQISRAEAIRRLVDQALGVEVEEGEGGEA